MCSPRGRPIAVVNPGKDTAMSDSLTNRLNGIWAVANLKYLWNMLENRIYQLKRFNMLIINITINSHPLSKCSITSQSE